MNDEQFMIQTFNQSFKKYLYDETVVGKLANTELKDNLRLGAEIDIIMPATVTLSDFKGGELNDAEEAANSVAKVRIDKGKSFHFYIDKVKEEQIKRAPDIKQKVALAKEYSADAIKQFAAAVDADYAKLYPNAGHYIDNGGSAITLSATNVKDLLSVMATEFQRGDSKGHNNWIDGQMIAIVPPEFQFFLAKQQMYEYVESGHKKYEKGFIGKLAGWDILVSNNIYKDGSGNFYPLFGQRGKTLAGGIQKKLDMMSYVPDKRFDTHYKGYGVYGVGAPRADLLGCAKVSATPTVGQ